MIFLDLKVLFKMKMEMDRETPEGLEAKKSHFYHS